MDYLRRTGDYVEFAVHVPTAGDYVLDFRYANGGTYDRPLELKVNGQIVQARLAFPPTGSWGAWRTAAASVTLPAGGSTVRLTAAVASGPNLDALTVRAVPQPVTLQAENADLSGPVVASNVSGFTGTGFADYQHGTGDSVEFTYEASAVGDYVLGFRYANGSSSDRPLALKVNGTVALASLPFAPTGGWSRWGTATATVALRPGNNKIRLTWIGSNGSNLDSLTVRAAAPVPAQDVSTCPRHARSKAG